MPVLMKGNTFKARKHRVKYPMLAEVKYDEIRLSARVWGDGAVDLLSYAEKPLNNLEQFHSAFRNVTLALEDDISWFDMGVLVNGNFNDTYRYLRSKTVKPEMLGWKIQFVLFDLPELDTDFAHRMQYRVKVRNMMRDYGFDMLDNICVEVRNEDDVMKTYEWARNTLKHEGLMLKTYDHKYASGKRTDGWLKVKPEDDADGKIVRLIEAHSLEGVPLGRVGSVEVELEDGSTATPAGFEHDLGRLMWENPQQFIGQWIEFKYMERDRAGGYRHPFFHRFREDKA